MDGNFETRGADGLVRITDGLATVEIAPAAGGALASYRWRKNGHVVDWLRPARRARQQRRGRDRLLSARPLLQSRKGRPLQLRRPNHGVADATRRPAL